MTLRPQRLVLLGLLALAPLAVYWFGVEKIANEPALAVVCVLLVVGSLWKMFSPADGASGLPN